MDNKEFGKELEKEQKNSPLKSLNYQGILPNSPEGKVIRNQITKYL